MLRENRSRLDSIVTQLLARETLDEAEVYAAAGIQRPPAPQAAPPVAKVARVGGLVY
jgi:cell division protease FtsH